MLIFLAMCLISCAAKTVTRTERVYVPPPQEYIRTIKIPEMTGGKNKDLLLWGLDLQKIVKQHNQDKKALQKWRDSIPEKKDEK